MNNHENLYFVKLTIDLAFKFIFGELKNIDLLKALLCDITKLPIERLEGLGLMGEELHRDSLNDHKTVVDVRAILTDKTQVAIEMQVQNYHDMGKRSLYGWAKMYSSQMKKSDRYFGLAKCICINITDFDFTEEDEGHSIYVIKNLKNNKILMDDLEIHFIELPKREKAGDTRLQKWMTVLSSQTWNEMAEAAKGDIIMEQVYNQAKEIAMNDAMRIDLENREKWIIDQNTLKWWERTHGREEGRLEGKIEGKIEGKLEAKHENAQVMLKDGLDIKKIILYTGLTAEEVEKLKH